MLHDPQTRPIPDTNLQGYRLLFNKAKAADNRARTARADGNAEPGNHAAYVGALGELADLLNGLSADAHAPYLQYGWPADQMASDYARDTSYSLQTALLTHELLSKAGEGRAGLHLVDRAVSATPSTLRAAQYAIEGTE